MVLLYVVNETGNYAVTLTREQIRLMKRNKDVPHLRGDDLANPHPTSHHPSA